MNKIWIIIAFLAILFSGWTPASAGGLTWQGLGPYNAKSGVSISQSDPEVLYGRFEGGGTCSLMKSLDGGAHWNKVTSGGESCLNIAIHPADPLVLYRYSTGSTIYRSADGGATWAPLEIGITSELTLFAVEPLPPYRLFVSQYSGGTRVSADQGQTWGPSSYPGYNAFEMVFLGPAPGTILARGWNLDFYKSTDGGATWTAGEGLPYGHSAGIIVDYSAPMNLYMLDKDTGNKYASTDQGEHWSLTTIDPFPMAFDSGTPGIYYASVGGLLKRTNNGGGTWTSIHGQLPAQISTFQIDPVNPNRLYVGTAVGLYRSSDRGANWAMLPTGDGSGYVMALAKGTHQHDPLYASLVNVSSAYAGVVKSAGSGSWNVLPGNLCGYVLAVDPLQANTLYGACDGQGVIRSEDGGGTWQPLGTGLTNLRISSLALADQGETLYAGARYYAQTAIPGGVYVSRNRGATWTISRTGMEANPGVQSLAVDPTNSDIIYAGMLPGVGVFRSQDGGQNWVQKINGLTSTDVRALVVLPTAPGTILAATYGGGIFISTNSGDNWAAANVGISGSPLFAYAFALDPVFPNTIYAAMGNGVYRSANRGASWENISQGLPTGVTSLLFDPASKNTLYAGSFGAGVYQLTLPQGYTISVPFVNR